MHLNFYQKKSKMSNISNELFLLIANLSQQRNKEKIISLFIHGLNSYFEGGDFKWIKKPRIEAQIVVCTKNKIYGEISYSKDFFENNTISLALAQNGAQMLAVIIERLEQEELLNNEKSHLEKLVEERTIELKESEGKLNALFTSLTEMVVMHEIVLNAAGEAIDYRIIDCNKVFPEVTGIPKEDAIGKLASQVYEANPPPYLEKFAKVALGGDPHEFTTYYAPLDRHFMISAVSPQAGKFATITTDISEMMQIQEMILAKNKEMENYLYVVSRDLRTPLVNIQGFSHRLKKQADSIKTLFLDKTLEPEILHQLGNITDENIPKSLNFILGNVEKMDTLINSLINLSRTGRVKMNIQQIDMNVLFAKILQSLDFQIKGAQSKIHIHSLPKCYGDAELLNQLFANIISNALKYSDPKRALEITVDAKEIYNKVVYTIKDTGKGIAQKHLDKIWDVFYRIDQRSGITGEGIGLSLVKRIAEKHKGKVWAESEENKGSVFNIELHNRTFTEL
jgi:signal transduction histidine kinase